MRLLLALCAMAVLVAACLADTDGDAEAEAEHHVDYAGCFDTKGCFGSPAGCEEDGDCDFMVTFEDVVDSHVQFTIHSKGETSGAGRYTAVGISDDAQMGEDLVFACHDEDSVYVGWNVAGDSNDNDPATGVDVTSAIFLASDGAFSCTFRVAADIEDFDPPGDDSNRDYELLDKEYYILMSAGTVSGDQLSYHGTSQLASRHKVSLKSVEKVKAKGTELIRLHGILMVIAWMARRSRNYSV